MSEVYLVTGGAGFIGSNLARELLARGATVRILDNFSSGKMENIAPFLKDISLLEGDIRDLDTLRKAMQGVDFVIHEAALRSVIRSLEAPSPTNEVNVEGTLNVLIAARDAGVKRVVFASSSSVYGDAPQLPKREDMALAPLSPYAVTKLAGEHYCYVFYKIYGLETVSLRYFNVYGPGQDPASEYSAVIPRFVRAMVKGEQPTIYGDGHQTRDFTYIADIVEATLSACRASNASGQAINVGGGQQTSVNELVMKLNKILGTKVSTVHVEPKKGEVRHGLADISKAKEVLGYSPRVNLDEGMRSFVQWFNTQNRE